MSIGAEPQAGDTWFFVLGAEDPEMNAIKRVLTLVGIAFAHATSKGHPVSAVTAYRADGATQPIPRTQRLCSWSVR